MPKKTCCQDEPDDIPAWFMTYSDVITLMMTFFILLLTFATDEPEHFERMQVAMFGGGSSSGVAGKNEEAQDRSSMLMRIRPRTARLTLHGSEMPPIDSDPSYESLDKGIKALDDPHDLADVDRLSMATPVSILIDSNGQTTPVGRQQLRMIAAQMRRMPLDLRFEVGDSQHIDASIALARDLINLEKIPPGRVGVGSESPSVKPGELRLSLIRTKAGR